MFKRNRIDLKAAKKAIGYYKLIPVRLVDIDLNKALEISHKHALYAYDAYFIECAKSCNAPLLTLDSHLASVARKMHLDVIEV